MILQFSSTSTQNPQITHNNISLPSPPPHSIYQYNTVHFVWITAAVKRCLFVWIFYINILRIYFLGAFVAVRKVTFSFVCLSLVSTERKNRPLMDGLSLNLVFGKFVEILWCYLKFLQNLLKIGGLLMKTDTHTHTHLYIYIYIYMHSL